jgi:predicted metal-binding membrane protein
VSFVESVLTRDRVIVLGAIASVTALAWLYILRLTATVDMSGMEMSGWRMVATGASMAMAPASEAWTPDEFGLTFAMWAVMMIGMMTPSAAPLALIYARAGQITRATHPFAATGWLVLGYLLVWSAFALGATSLQWALDRSAWLDWSMTVTRQVASAFLMVAGVYQWTPLKHACLSTCQSPLAFLQRLGGFRGDAASAISTGLRHGAYCVGCCWALMTLLFVGGVMNPAWIAVLTAFALFEKIAPVGPWFSRGVGILLIVLALILVN